MRSGETPWKIVLLGGDGRTANTYMAAAALEGHRLDYFASMHDIGYLGRLREYDAAIVHDDMRPLSGLELAEYLEKLFQSLPMILLTRGSEADYDHELFPASVVDCCPAWQDAHVVLEQAVLAARQPRERRAPRLLAVERG